MKIDFAKMCKLAMVFSGFDSIYGIYRIDEGYVFAFFKENIEDYDLVYVLIDEKYRPSYYLAPDEPVDIIYKIKVPDEYKYDGAIK